MKFSLCIGWCRMAFQFPQNITHYAIREREREIKKWERINSTSSTGYHLIPFQIFSLFIPFLSQQLMLLLLALFSFFFPFSHSIWRTNCVHINDYILLSIFVMYGFAWISFFFIFFAFVFIILRSVYRYSFHIDRTFIVIWFIII